MAHTVSVRSVLTNGYVRGEDEGREGAEVSPVSYPTRSKISVVSLVAGILQLSVAGGSAAAVLHAISGDGATPSSSLYSLDESNAAPTLIGSLGNGDDGEGIAFRPEDGLLYHTSGGTDGLEFFEAVNPDDTTVGANLVPADTYGPSAAGEIFAISWYAPLGVFIASDLNFDFYHLTPAGQFTLVGNSGVQMRGFAVVGSRVYAVSPSSAQLFEVDPATGAILATLPLSVGGMATTGNGLATHPETGVVYTLVKNPAAPSGGRLLATLDVSTGQAVSIGNTGIKLAGIAFRTHAPLYAITGDGALPASTLFTLHPASGVPTFAKALGNGDDGEAIARRIDDGLLYHASGVSSGQQFFETIDPDTLVVGSNLAPGGNYGPDPMGEVTAMAWYPPLGVFLACDGSFDCFHVAPDGAATFVGSSGLRMRGFAVVGSKVYGVSPFAHQLYRVDPFDGSILETLPLTVDGLGTTGNGLATSPDTGVVFAIVKNPLSPSGSRLLARLDVTSGAAISLGDTGLKFAGLTFGRRELPPEVPALTPLGRWAVIIATLAVALRRNGSM